MLLTSMQRLWVLGSSVARVGQLQYHQRGLTSGVALQQLLSKDTINQRVVNAEYAVRGAVPQRAEELKRELERGADYGFKEVIFASIGNPQALEQKPLTYIRQVLAILDYPNLVEEHPNIFPQDVVDRAKEYMKKGVKVGAYSHSLGVSYLRKEVAKSINRRDDSAISHDSVFLCSGASEGISHLMELMITTTATLVGGAEMYYSLSEEDGWDLSMEALQSTIAKYKAENKQIRGIVVINPGNPTGTCLELSSMEQVRSVLVARLCLCVLLHEMKSVPGSYEIIELCAKENIVLLADEVYQTNVYNPEERPFHSFAKVLAQSKYKDDVELASFHSVSKGMIGECGRRGGYMHVVNFNQDVLDQIEKRFSINLCANVAGQVVTALMCNPPEERDESYKLYRQEYDEIYHSLSRRQMKLQQAFDRMEGISCREESRSSMYLFPSISLSEKAIQAAKEFAKEQAKSKNIPFKEEMVKPDEFYCLKLLEATGLCVVPGSGFKQEKGTYHFRTTFLPPEEKFDSFIERFEKFHNKFMSDHA